MLKRINRSSLINSGFSIAELLIVIVVIAIIAAITMVGYNLVLKNTIATSLQSNLKNAAKQLVVDNIRSSTGTYPATLAVANNGTGIDFPSNTTTTYTVDNTDTPNTFCLTATQNSQTYFITQESRPLSGPCPVLYLDAGIQTSYPGTDVAWNDLSGLGNNGTISGLSYAQESGGTLVFNGSAGYVDTGSPSIYNTLNNSITIEAWLKTSTLAGLYQRIVSKQYNATNTTADSCFQLGISSTNKWRWSVGGVFDITLSSPSPLSNTWYYFVGTYDKSQTNMYINGALVNSSTAYTSPIRTNSSQILSIGTTDVSGVRSYYFSGRISSISVHNVALSGDVIQNKFNALRSRFGL